jgi:hypothetical protein
MKKKLSLSTETLRSLSTEELSAAGGGTQATMFILVPRISAAGCPTLDAACAVTIRTIGLSPIIRF